MAVRIADEPHPLLWMVRRFDRVGEQVVDVDVEYFGAFVSVGRGAHRAVHLDDIGDHLDASRREGHDLGAGAQRDAVLVRALRVQAVKEPLAVAVVQQVGEGGGCPAVVGSWGRRACLRSHCVIQVFPCEARRAGAATVAGLRAAKPPVESQGPDGA
jgi:hypothetical protein